ncbi:membrane protein [Capnocytophaga canis]|nr:membrane protein [Capnocytophaga canis]
MTKKDIFVELKKRMKKVLFVMITLFTGMLSAQSTEVKGTVYSVQDNKGIANVHVLNLNSVKGTTTNEQGYFSIKATVNDTLYLSFLGYKSIKVLVTNDMIRFPDTKIGMTELAYALEEVVITPYKLTGYLDIDAKNAPVNENKRYSISGLEIGYESRANASMVGRILSSVMNPADMLYRLFSSKGQEVRKLQKLKDDNKLSDALSQRYDRETLLELLQVDRAELENIIRSCNYSNEFIMSANDLQILDAISNCYEEYRVLNRKKK